LAAGAFLMATILVWLTRLDTRGGHTTRPVTETAAWSYFMWASLALLIIYVTLAIVFLDF
jgi:hypothetical protein